MTEKESAHPTTQQLHELTIAATANGDLDLVGPASSPSLVPPRGVGEEDPLAAGGSDVAVPLPQGTGIQPPTENHTLPVVEDLKISDKALSYYGGTQVLACA
ncbi:putative HID1-like 4 [Homarus americanus]|uniref:Putative HID1-like 4 n=1 Tax=Homarus americanus TaxID=6706 RepID=A0A8J5JTU6_HOMAM|nr:putative HID1-like 4 [Homarus americanus]